MAMVPRTFHDAALAQLIDAAVAHMRPPGRALLHDAHSTSGTRPMLKRQTPANAHHFLMRAPQRHMQKAQRVEKGMRRVPESLDHDLLRDLGGARPFGM